MLKLHNCYGTVSLLRASSDFKLIRQMAHLFCALHWNCICRERTLL